MWCPSPQCVFLFYHIFTQPDSQPMLRTPDGAAQNMCDEMFEALAPCLPQF